MQTICRLIQLPSAEAEALLADPGSLPTRVRSAKVYGDVYRYWHAIEYLLARHRPGSAAARWLSMGTGVSPATADVPGARLLSAAQVQQLDAELRGIPEDDLAAHYDASALDAARVYPATWKEWEEEFDPLGQVLEHYSFLQMAAEQAAGAGAALLLFFDLLAEGTV